MQTHSGFLFWKHLLWQFIFCIIEHRTTIPCYCPIFTFYLSHSKTESSLLLALKGCFLLLIFCLINTSFHIHFPLFIYWEQNISFVCPTCCRYSADLFDVDLDKEIQVGWISMKESVFCLNSIVHALFTPLPFCI